MRWLKLALMAATGLLGWLGRTFLEGWTGRSFAAEASEREEAQAREDAAAEAQAQARADRVEAASRHEENAALLEQQIAESKALKEVLVHQARRREQIAAQSRSHDVEVRSSRWTADEEPEQEGSAPMPVYA